MAAMKSGDRVVVAGLSDFRRALKQLGDKELSDDLKAANRQAAQIVVDKARPSMAAEGGIAGRVAATMKAGNVQSRGQLSVGAVATRRGGKLLPLGVEFGAVRGIDRVVQRRGQPVVMKGWNQFPAWRGNGADAGYHIFPALRQQNERIMQQYGEELERLYAKAFPDR